jgi:ABC-2 type transport system ATP-binding protein
MSLGEKRKVMLSFSLATRCKVLLFDEPTNGLDIPSKAVFRKLIASSLEDNQTIVLATHQVRDLSNIVDRIIIEHQGKIVLNEGIDCISDKLLFGSQSANMNAEDLIYTQNGIAMDEFIAINRNGQTGTLDIELLFNAAVTDPEKLISVFNTNIN